MKNQSEHIHTNLIPPSVCGSVCLTACHLFYLTGTDPDGFATEEVIKANQHLSLHNSISLKRNLCLNQNFFSTKGSNEKPVRTRGKN